VNNWSPEAATDVRPAPPEASQASYSCEGIAITWPIIAACRVPQYWSQ
jgi:hypothetical protein